MIEVKSGVSILSINGEEVDDVTGPRMVFKRDPEAPNTLIRIEFEDKEMVLYLYEVEDAIRACRKPVRW